MGSILGLGVLTSWSSCGTDFLATLESGVLEVTGSGSSETLNRYLIKISLNTMICNIWCVGTITACKVPQSGVLTFRCLYLRLEMRLPLHLI